MYLKVRFESLVRYSNAFYLNFSYEKEAETCIGCMRNPANIKLTRMCTDLETEECKRCHCKPMWCLECKSSLI